VLVCAFSIEVNSALKGAGKWRLTILVAELVGRPHAAVSVRAVDSVHEPVALGLRRVRPLVLRVAQQPRRHARPKGEDDEGEQVAHGHGIPPLAIDVGAKVG